MTKHEKFKEIYERYAILVLKSVMVQTRDQSVSEDICQQTFLQLYRCMETLDMDFVKLWLFQVSQNLLIDYWRQEGRKSCFSQEHKNGRESKSQTLSIEKQCLDSQLIRQILENLAQKNQEWYEAVENIIIKGMGYQEASYMLGIETSVLRKRLSRARQYIRQTYGEDYLE